MKKTVAITLIIILILGSFVGCQNTNNYTKYDYSFFGTFNTIVQVIAYTKNEEEFTSYMTLLEERFFELHKLYDRFNDYEGINNIKTINDNAGIKPVKVEKEIIDLILFAKDLYSKTGNLTNIAMGAVTDIWNEYREEGTSDPENAQIPPMSLLESAGEHTDINKIIVNQEEGTIYILDPDMKIDVGAVAKGFATEIVAKEMEQKGLNSAMISAGGNIRAIGKPLDGIKDKWGVGIQNPDRTIFDEARVLELIFITDASVVSSGDYQRYYIVDGEIFHHIVHPETLMPTNYYRQVTIVTPDSGVADFYSTAVFLLPFEESKQLVDSVDNLEAIWVFADGNIHATEGMKKIMQSYGATNAIKK